MSGGPEFFQTHIGRRFYEGTLPQLVTQIGRLADGVERLVLLLETVTGVRKERASDKEGAGAAPTKKEEKGE